MTPGISLRVSTLLVAALLVGSAPAHAQSLRGSPASLTRQNAQAHEHDYSYLRTSGAVRDFIDRGLLVRVRASSNLRLDDDVSFPYARPEVRLFVERLAAQYRDVCGEKLVVTSLTRPLSRQPANASDRSVHPTGMALDLRRSKRRSCRNWLEETLLSLEGKNVLEATKENHPSHYHVAVYPTPYRRYVAGLGGTTSTDRLAMADAAEVGDVGPGEKTSGPRVRRSDAAATTERIASASREAASSGSKYKVNRGDTLWGIARRMGTTVDTLKRVNHLASGRIIPGQVLTIPTR